MKKPPEIQVIHLQSPTIEISALRYEELVAKERELNLLKNALRVKSSYNSVDEIKAIFNIKNESEE